MGSKFFKSKDIFLLGVPPFKEFDGALEKSFVDEDITG